MTRSREGRIRRHSECPSCAAQIPLLREHAHDFWHEVSLAPLPHYFSANSAPWFAPPSHREPPATHPHCTCLTPGKPMKSRRAIRVQVKPTVITFGHVLNCWPVTLLAELSQHAVSRQKARGRSSLVVVTEA